MRRTLRNTVFYGFGLVLIAMMTTGCEPEFTDDVCETDDDCFPDERCDEDRCVIAEGEENECGGTEPLDGAVGDPCGPCDLDRLECSDDGEALVCDGETECPDLDIVTTLPTNVEATTATFNGRIEALPEDASLVELGFCWTDLDSEAPTLDHDCATLDEVPQETGDFSLDVEDLRPGTYFYVRAYSMDDAADDEEYANEVEFETEPMAPEGLEADGDDDAVHLSWDETPGAVGYEVFADGESIAEIDDPEETSYIDETAPAGTVGTPENYEASTDRTDGVELTWDAAQPAEGATVEYTVTAQFPNSVSDPSEPAEGNRTGGEEPTGYEVYIGADEPEEEDWIFVGNDQDYLDEDAPTAELTAGTITASDGEYGGHVLLRFDDDPTVETTEQTYRVRATYGDDDEMFGAPTPEFEGHRDAGDLEYQWYRSAGDSDDDYSAIDGATSDEYEDTDAPSDGSIRYYYATVSAPGAEESVDTNTDSGSISTVGHIDSVTISNIDATSADLSAQLISAGTPASDEHGFCYATDEDPTYPDDNCIPLGTPDEGSPDMSTSIDSLDQGTQYHVRAFVHSTDSGNTAYSSNESFTTDAPAPTNISATGSLDEVTVSWDEATGATGYEVIDGDDNTVATVTDPAQTSIDDGDAPAGTVSAPSNPQASSNMTNGIELTWEDADELPGADVDYRVIAIYPDATSDPSSEATGNRDAPTITGYEWSIAGENDWSSAGNGTNVVLDESAPEAAIDAGTATASQGEFEDHIALAVEDAEVGEADTRSYELRATYGTDSAGDPTGSFDGQRDTGELQYQWYKSAGETADDFELLSGADSATYDDSDVPGDGTSRHYYATVSADGAISEDTNTAEGFVGAAPDAPTGLMASTTHTDRVELEWDSVTDADSYVVYREGEDDPIGTPTDNSFTDNDPVAADLPPEPDSVEANSSGATSIIVSWSDVDADRGDNDREYTVAAVIDGTEGEESSPQTGYVAAPDVVGYEISFDGGDNWSDTDSAESHTDDSAAPPTIEFGTPTATDDHPDHVELGMDSDNGPIEVEAATVTYYVRTVDDDGRTSSGVQTTGQRATEPVEARWEYFDEGDSEWTTLAEITAISDPSATDDTLDPGESRDYRVVAQVEDADDTETTSAEVTGERADDL